MICRSDDLIKAPALEFRGREFFHPDFAQKLLGTYRHLKGVAIDECRERVVAYENAGLVDIPNDTSGGMHACYRPSDVKRCADQEAEIRFRKARSSARGGIEGVDRALARYERHGEANEVAAGKKCVD